MSSHLLFIGDSLTQGKLGVNFVNIIKPRYRDLVFHNKGKGGETLLEVSERLIKILKEDKQKFFLIVFEAGINDLLLPHVKQKWPFMNIKSVTPVSQFESLLEERLKTIISLTNAKIIVTTISCIGEIYNSQLNQQRRLINEQIKRVCFKYNLGVADVSSIFDEIILNSNSSGYLLENVLNLVTDYFRSVKSKWADKISSKRNLSLTIDGVHLNSKGAQIYCKEISAILDTNFI
ncbi:MAG: SGNH/GDSL hydrolase family protein [Promethearchaeota archaeon]|jgi:lysophospholipase L1-like esterase